MRLIDLDKVVSIRDEDNNTVIFANIENAEVKAIPVEWIDNYISKWENAETHGVVKTWWLIMKRDWEKENE